jgi:outer membrane protein assembly factor BamB
MSRRNAGYRLLGLWLWTCALVIGADWLSKRGDPQQTGWQREEKFLTVHTVQGLRLLWERKLSDQPNGLTDPVLLGPIITHRGIKELVFVKNSADTVYAVDADLGTIFWSRPLARAMPKASILKTPCAESSSIAPVMAPAPEEPRDSSMEDEDHFSDGNKPLYVLSADGSLYVLRPSTGGDFSPPLPFLPPSAKAMGLAISDDILYTTTSSVCGGAPNRVWTLNLKVGSDPQSQPWQGNNQMLAVFKWKGRDLLAGWTSSNQPVLRKATNDPLLLQSSTPKSSRLGGLAAWEDAAGTRWIYTTSAAGVRAFQVAGPMDQPTAISSWTSLNLTAAGPPVVANGILYFLSVANHGRGSRLILHALNAFDGKDLYTSSDIIMSRSFSGNLAIANGHVCFSSDGILYCFGLPFEM